jgi:hypothetical protein
VTTLELRYESLDALRADVDANLKKARAFVRGSHALGERERCELVLVHPQHDGRLTLQAEAVWVGPDGVGLELLEFDSAKPSIEAFAAEGSAADAETDEGANRQVRNLHDKMRHLSLREREEIARRGSLSERVALERAFGGAVWEGLLQNPQLTPPEVMRIAKNGTLPKPLVGIIVGNASWLANAEVQRALLGNPRCTGANLERVMRALKPAEVVRLSQVCPYRSEVKAMAQKLTLR